MKLIVKLDSQTANNDLINISKHSQQKFNLYFKHYKNIRVLNFLGKLFFTSKMLIFIKIIKLQRTKSINFCTCFNFIRR